MMTSPNPKDPALFLVFGATGDLMRRKLLPALYHLSRAGRLPQPLAVLGVARGVDMDDAAFRAWCDAALAEFGQAADADSKAWCDSCLHYQPMGEGKEGYAALAARVAEIEASAGLGGNRIIYLAVPPAAFEPVIEGIGKAGLSTGDGWTRLVIEKPFGRDLRSAIALNATAHRFFDESQVYRIDHYLGKETVQNLLAFRFANPVFESQWNRDHIERVEITVAESLGVEGRAGYYETAGALRDMVQNHMTQLLSLVAMEVPVAFEADAIRSEKIKALRAVAPIDEETVVVGQYAAGSVGGQPVPAYADEPDVAPGSATDTFAAMTLRLDNWRWQGVPFHVRTGKRLARRLTQVVVTFRRAPVSLFAPFDATLHRNFLRLVLQPDEGFELWFQVKRPGSEMALQFQALDFYYREAFGPLPEAYQTLLLDLLRGDQTLFVHADEVEVSWRLYEPLLDHGLLPVHYVAGSWGPAEADRLVRHEGGRWLNEPPRARAAVSASKPA